MQKFLCFSWQKIKIYREKNQSSKDDRSEYELMNETNERKNETSKRGNKGTNEINEQMIECKLLEQAN